jgi:hypothetical protein
MSSPQKKLVLKPSSPSRTVIDVYDSEGERNKQSDDEIDSVKQLKHDTRTL